MQLVFKGPYLTRKVVCVAMRQFLFVAGSAYISVKSITRTVLPVYTNVQSLLSSNLAIALLPRNSVYYISCPKEKGGRFEGEYQVPITDPCHSMCVLFSKWDTRTFVSLSTRGQYVDGIPFFCGFSIAKIRN